LLRIGDDWYFDQVMIDTTIHVRVTAECAVEVFGSDGSEGDSFAKLMANKDKLEVLAIRKALHERAKPIVITARDINW
jgi:hypothetical protein